MAPPARNPLILCYQVEHLLSDVGLESRLQGLVPFSHTSMILNQQRYVSEAKAGNQATEAYKQALIMSWTKLVFATLAGEKRTHRQRKQ